jgi:hypothetical protein
LRRKAELAGRPKASKPIEEVDTLKVNTINNSSNIYNEY